jgi:hypothetical protein
VVQECQILIEKLASISQEKSKKSELKKGNFYFEGCLNESPSVLIYKSFDMRSKIES